MLEITIIARQMCMFYSFCYVHSVAVKYAILENRYIHDCRFFLRQEYTESTAITEKRNNVKNIADCISFIPSK